jgi:energy-converting hydrogenase Eha subunit G
MLGILNGIQGLVNLLFFVAVAGTLVVSWVYADRLKKQYSADFPWNKTAMIAGIEVLLWIGFNLFWEIFEAYWWQILIVAVIAIVLISRKKRRYV